MIIPVEAFFDVCLQNILGLMADVANDGFEGILRATPRSEPVTFRLEPCFPLWLQCQLDQGLFGSVAPFVAISRTNRS